MKNVDFKSLLEAQYATVMKEFPTAFFYEMQVVTNNADNEVMDLTDVREISFVFQVVDEENPKAIVYLLSDGVEQRTIYDGYWLEDRPLTPYLPADLEQAYERLKSANYICKSAHVVLRHPLAPGFIEPVYIFGDTMCEFVYYVGCFSADVEVNKGPNLPKSQLNKR